MIDGNRGWIRAGVLTAVCLLVPACSTSKTAERNAQSDEPEETRTEEASEGDQEQGHHHDGSDHQKKRFKDPEERAEDWNAPERDRWQRPEAVVEAMGIEEGMTVADVGAGTGYFVPYLSEAVGESGRVLAVDIEEAMLEYVEKLADEKGIENLETVRAEKTDSNLQEGAVDRILIVNTWHHIPDRGEYAEHLRKRLTDGGEVWIVDFQRDSPTGPPKKHRLAPEEIVEELEMGGLEAEVHPLELDRQYVVVGRVD